MGNRKLPEVGDCLFGYTTNGVDEEFFDYFQVVAIVKHKKRTVLICLRSECENELGDPCYRPHAFNTKGEEIGVFGRELFVDLDDRSRPFLKMIQA